MEGYASSLDSVSRARYFEKIEILNAKDPYTIPKNEWSGDFNLLPPVSYIDIVNYLVLGKSPFCSMAEMRNYKSLTAYDRFVCGWVRDVKCYTTDGDGIHVVAAQVMHSQRLNDAPLHPWFIANSLGLVLTAHCDCMAGLGESCSHVASLMFAVESIVRLREKTTVTQEPAYWMLPTSLKKVDYKPIRDIDFTSSKTLKKKLDMKIDCPTTNEICSELACTNKIGPNTDDNFSTFLNSISACKPACLAVHSDYSDQYIPLPLQTHFPQVIPELFDETLLGLPYQHVLEHCTHILPTLQVTEQEVQTVEAATRNQASSPVWFQFRAGRITASKMYSVTKTSIEKPSKSLLRQICYPAKVHFSSAATNWGCKHEANARESFATLSAQQHLNFTLEECGLFLSCEHPHLGATPDGIVDCDCCGRGCLEIKCPYCAKDDIIDDRIKYLETVDGALRLKREHQYYYQVQTQLYVTSLDYCDFVVWTNKEIFVQRMTPDPSFWRPVEHKSLQFFSDVVLPEMVARHFLTDSSHNDAPKAAEELFCICRTPEDDRKYVGCDGKDCEIKWFHFECVGLVKKPRGKWYCTCCLTKK